MQLKHLPFVLCLCSGLTFGEGFLKASDNIGNIDLNIEEGTQVIFHKVDVAYGEDLEFKDGTITVNKDGLYEINYNVSWSSDVYSDPQIKTYLLKNNTDLISGSIAYGSVRGSGQFTAGATNHSSIPLKLLRGDTVKLMAKGVGTLTKSAATNIGESSLDMKLLNPLGCAGYTGPLAKVENDYCLGNIAGGKWKLVAVRDNGVGVPVTEITNTTDSQYLADEIWQDTLQNTVNEILFYQPDTEYWGLVSLSHLYAMPLCKRNIFTTLGEEVLYWTENSGCDYTGRDYSGVGLYVGSFYFRTIAANRHIFTASNILGAPGSLASKKLYVFIR